MAIGRELTLGGNGMAVLEKEFVNVIFHGVATPFLLVVPIKVYACKTNSDQSLVMV